MRVYIRINGGIKFFIPVPIGLAKLGCRIADSQFIRRNIPEDALQYYECVDFKELENSLDTLRQYKGLTLVDVHSKDGTEVTIIS